jgi:hypothetical protein
MKASFAAVVFLCSMFLGTRVASAQQSPFWCIYTVNAGTADAVHYVNDNLVQADDVSYHQVEEAWMSYIRSTYAISPLQDRANSSTGCNKVSTDAPGGPSRFISQTEQAWKARGNNIIHLNWTYTPSAAVAPTGTPSANSSASKSCAPVQTIVNHKFVLVTPEGCPAQSAQQPPPSSNPNPAQHRISALASAASTPAPPAPTATVTHTSTAAPYGGGPAAAAAKKAYRCIFDFRESKQWMRYSGGPFVTAETGPVLSAAWKQFIDETYHPSDPNRRGGCVMLGGASDLERAVSSFEANSNQHGVKTTHVDWHSSP